MSRYINTDDIRITANTVKDENGEVFVSLTDVRKAIEQTPTADVVKVRHGEYHNTRFTDGVFYQEQCSMCGEWTYEYDKNFCPHCGSKMDGKT